MAEQWSQPVALVTGAARGLGFEIARQLARKNLMVILTARDLDKASEAAEKLTKEGLNVVPAVGDVSNDDSIRRLATKVEANFKHLDILVNNAGAYSDWQETPTIANFHAVKEVMEINLFGAWRTVQAFLPLLKKSSHPRIVNVASGAGTHSDPVVGLDASDGKRASFGVSKAALIALTSQLASELKGTGILVNAVCPGATATATGHTTKLGRPPQESALGIVWAALLPDNGPSGGFFRDGKRIPW